MATGKGHNREPVSSFFQFSFCGLRDIEMPLKIVGVSVTYSCDALDLLLWSSLTNSPNGRRYDFGFRWRYSHQCCPCVKVDRSQKNGKLFHFLWSAASRTLDVSGRSERFPALTSEVTFVTAAMVLANPARSKRDNGLTI
jgi:hypothetical protein